jgi:hypothetical protein
MNNNFHKIINLDHVNQILFNRDGNMIEFVFQNCEVSTIRFQNFNDLINEYEIIKRIWQN